MRRGLEAGEPDRGEGLSRPGAEFAVDRPEGATTRPMAHGHEVEHADRKAAVDLRLLRKVGEPTGQCLVDLDAPRAGGDPACQRVEQAALARAVGPDDGGE